MPDSVERPPVDGQLSFDLTCRPWMPVLRQDGSEDELSLIEIFARAHEVRRLVGDLPTQEFALLRLLLAVAHDALDGPQAIDAWAELWEDEHCFAVVADYLEEHHERFDLFHPHRPFFQVSGLRTARDEVFSLNRIVADVPNGEPFISSYMPTVERLDFAAAARWLVHAQAFDTSGIKTGVVGDSRIKKGKVYPLGVGWAGTLGGVFIEGTTLRETLLLNLVAADTEGVRFGPDDRPAWRREPEDGPGPGPHRWPSGLRDLYTWQTRRIRLHADASDVTGVVLGYGDPLAPHNMHRHEPMTAWRRSQAQEKKRGESLVYLPREHDPARAAWRGLESLITNRAGSAQASGPAASLRPSILGWVARLATEGFLRRGYLVRARTVGAVYGTQQSVIDEVVDDRVAMAVVLLHNQDREYGQEAIDAVGDADKAVKALGDLAADLARASGSESETGPATARDLGFAALDGLYREWLSTLGAAEDPHEHRVAWQCEAHRIISRLGNRLLADAGDTAWAGRLVETRQGRNIWLNSGLADCRFRNRLGDVLGHPERGASRSIPGEDQSSQGLTEEVHA